ncbi:MAG: PAS domain-containing protein [Phyllobacteriaceae bacterium]|jgi:PAS domain S-box-containing protein|nr:PAS domain-containing protein [Phyllobacteriaceae bacterium]
MTEQLMAMTGSPALLSLIDAVGSPVFLVGVEEEATFRLLKLNRAHEQATGMSSDAVKGKTLEELLPPRMASQIAANYQYCVDTKADHTYEEFLNLGTGERWWQTTLTPMLDADGKVYMIVGIAADITNQKSSQISLAQRHGEIIDRIAEIRFLSSTTAQDMGLPLRELQSITQQLKDGFSDLGDGKLALIDRLEGVVARSIAEIDTVVERCLGAHDDAWSMTSSQIDRLCGDLLSILDPLGECDVRYPTGYVRADGAVLNIVLRAALMAHLSDGAEQPARIDISMEQSDPATLRIMVLGHGPDAAADAQRPATGRFAAVITGLRQLLVARGGTIWVETSNGAAVTGIGFSLRGFIETTD